MRLSAFSKFSEDMKLERAADKSGGFAAIQWDLDRPEEWAERNVIKFNKQRYKILYPGKINFTHQYVVGTKKLKCSCKDKELEVLMKQKLNLSQQCALTPKRPTPYQIVLPGGAVQSMLVDPAWAAGVAQMSFIGPFQPHPLVLSFYYIALNNIIKKTYGVSFRDWGQMVQWIHH